MTTIKFRLIPLITLIVGTGLSAQTMERQVISAGGGFIQTPAGTLHWTAGETVVAPCTAGAVYIGAKASSKPGMVFEMSPARTSQTTPRKPGRLHKPGIAETKAVAGLLFPKFTLLQFFFSIFL